MRKNIYDKVIISNDIELEDFCNLCDLLRDICNAKHSFQQFKFTKSLPKESCYLADAFEHSMEVYFQRHKDNIINILKANKGYGDKQLFETFVTFFDNYYVNYMFSVEKALDIIDKNNIEHGAYRTQDLMQFCKLIETNGELAKESINKPIILLDNPVTSTPIMVIDGNHRVKHYNDKNIDTIQAYRLDSDYVKDVSICEPIYKLIELMIIACDIYISYRMGQVDDNKMYSLYKMIDEQNIMI